MKFFTAVAQAKCASEMLKAAGFDLAEMEKTADVNALKAAIEAKVSAGWKAPADAEKILAAAAAENKELAETNAKLLARQSALLVSLNASGIKIQESDDFSTGVTGSVTARVTALAAEKLAASGHAPVASEITADPTKTGSEKKRELTGLSRSLAYFEDKRK